jgi:hypothetical protein
LAIRPPFQIQFSMKAISSSPNQESNDSHNNNGCPNPKRALLWRNNLIQHVFGHANGKVRL